MTTEYSDLIARLRDDAGYLGHEYKATVGETLRDAADALTRLSQRVAELDLERDQAVAEACGYREQHARDSYELRRLCSERDELKTRIAALESQLAARESAEPVAWLTHGALAGNPMLTFEPISEIASEPLYAHPPAAAASDRYSWTETGMKHDVEGSWVLASHNVKLPF